MWYFLVCSAINKKNAEESFDRLGIGDTLNVLEQPAFAKLALVILGCLQKSGGISFCPKRYACSVFIRSSLSLGGIPINVGSIVLV